MDNDKAASDENQKVAIRLGEILKGGTEAKIKKLRVFLDEIL
jgi:hypothetical protein